MVGVKCPRCGLMQMPGPSCKSCGTPLGASEMRYVPPTAQVSGSAPPSRPPDQAVAPPPGPVSTMGFSKGEAIRFGWNAMMSNPGFFVMLLIVVALIYIFPEMLRKSMEQGHSMPSLLLALISAVLQIIIGMGLIRISLSFADSEKGRFGDLFACVPLFFKYLFSSILYALIVLAGTILFIIPGIVWGIKYMFFGYLIVDQGLGPVEALKRSGTITHGAKWNLFLFGFVLFGVNLLGVLALLIGLFATIPTSMVAMAYVYRMLQKQA